jgi:hypothetical protein
LADDERRAITLTLEQLEALAKESNPVEREKLLAQYKAQAIERSSPAPQQVQPQQDHQPYRPSHNPSAALEGPAPGGNTSHRSSAARSFPPTPAQIEPEHAPPNAERSVDARGSPHDPNPQFIEAKQRLDNARQHARSLHEDYLPPTAKEITGKREGSQNTSGGGPGASGPDGPKHDGPTSPGSASSSEGTKSLDAYAVGHKNDSSHRFNELDPAASLKQSHDAAAGPHQSQAAAEVEKQEKGRAAFFEDRAEASTPDKEREARVEQPQRSKEQTDKSTEQQARRQQRVAHMIARRQAAKTQGRGGLGD